MKSTITLLLLTISLSFTSCIGPALSARGKISAHDREAFAKANADREAAGLPPLTKKQFMNMETTAPTTRVITTTTDSPSTTQTVRIR